MRSREQIATSASTQKTGLVAVLCNLFRGQGSGAPRGGALALPAMLAVLFGVLALGAVPAFASGAPVYSSSFGSEGSEPGKFSDPSGVAVSDATGNVYVVDRGDSRVEEFNAEGAFVAEFNGKGTAGELSEPEAIAVDNSGSEGDPSKEDVYVTDHNVVDKFSASGEYKGHVTGACAKEGEVPPSCGTFVPFAPLDGVAVDPKGVVWVYQEGKQIDAFSDAVSNVFLSSRESLVGGSTVQPDLAVNSEDDLYIGHGVLRDVGEVNSSGNVLTSRIGTEEGATGVAVDPSSNDVYIDSGDPEESTPEIQEFAPNGSSIATFGQVQLADHGGAALAVSYAGVSSGDIYVVDSTADKVDIFTPPKVAVHALSASFGGEGSHALSEPMGIAVNDETEDVYVVDRGHKRVEEFSDTGAFITEFAPPGGFSDPERIAVDNSGSALDSSDGDVYVTDGESIDKFSSTGTYEYQLTGTCPEKNETEVDGSCEPSGAAVNRLHLEQGLAGVAVDPEGNVWAEARLGKLIEYSGSGNYLTTYNMDSVYHGGDLAVGPNDTIYYIGFLAESEFNQLDLASGQNLTIAVGHQRDGLALDGGLALDAATGGLFLDRLNEIEEYGPVEEANPSPLSSFGAPSLQGSSGVTVSPATSTVYATSGGPAGSVEIFKEYPLPRVSVGAGSSLRPESVTLEGLVNPEGAPVKSCEFEYGPTASYGQTAECEPPAGSLGEGGKPVPVSVKLTGLTSGTTYHYRLVASNTAGTNLSSDQVLTTPGPEIGAEQVTFVEATSATLQAQIDPRGTATSYHFEYDTSPYTSGASHGTSLPAQNGQVGSGNSPVSVSVRAQGLLPGTTYHYRVVAEGEPLGAPAEFDGQDKTFSTPAALGSAPPQHCENEKLRLEQPYGAGLPDCRAYETVSPVEAKGSDATDPSALGYNSEAVSPPEAAVSGEAVAYVSVASFAGPTGSGTKNEFLSRRGPRGWSTQDIEPLHDASGGEYGFSSYENAVFTSELTEGVTRTNAQLTSEAPQWEKTTWGLYVDDFASGSYRYVGDGNSYYHIAAVGASTDLSHVVFGENAYGKGLFEWVNGKVSPISVANDGKSLESAEVEGLHVVSSDGSRVFFKSGGQVYLRENAEREQSAIGAGGGCVDAARACTVAVSAGPARFWGASTDGSEAFFTEGEELDRYDVESGQTVALAGAVQGVVQISEDGSYVYFVAKNALEGVGGVALRNGRGVEPVAGEDNLYLLHAGAAQFVVTLSGGDAGDWASPGGLEENNAVVAPGGAWLAFMSERSLTGYDNERAAELFLYDAGTGSVECASCDPTGARPVGSTSLSDGGGSQYRPRALVEDGALFFDSSDALVPHASDGLQNVYEYEGGHVYAISNVAGGSESFFLDASANGHDVFFGTADDLLPEDVSNNVVVYDARVDGGFPVAVSPAPCDNGDSCKPPPTPQPGVFGAPASATFSGEGNIPPTSIVPTPVKSTKKAVKCAKGRKLTHGKCVRKKTAKKLKAKKSSHRKGSN